MKIEAAPHAKAHQTYHDVEGNRLPGVTTVLNVMGKPFLIPWANKLGLEGYEVGPYTAAQAKVGTISHALIEAELRGELLAIADYEPNEVDRARNVLRSFQAWRADKLIEPIILEEGLVSTHGYGGTIDFYGRVDGLCGVIDFKSSNDIYDEQKIQVCTYAQLLLENDHRVDFAMLLRMPRTDDADFFVWQTSTFGPRYDLFLALLNVHRLLKAVGDDNPVPVKKTRKQKTAAVTASGDGSWKEALDPSPVSVNTE